MRMFYGRGKRSEASAHIGRLSHLPRGDSADADNSRDNILRIVRSPNSG